MPWRALLSASLFVSLTGLVGADEPTAARQEKIAERSRLIAEANQLNAQGKVADAIAVAEKVLALERELLGETHERVITTLSTIAELHEKGNDTAGALKKREEALAVGAKRYGKDHWQTTALRMNLQVLSRWAALAPVEQRALREARVLRARAARKLEESKYREAYELRLRMMSIFERVLEHQDIEYLTGLHDLAISYTALGDYAKAETLLRQVLEASARLIGERHPSYIQVLHDLAKNIANFQDYDRAEPVCHRVLQLILQRTLFGFPAFGSLTP